MLRFKNKDTMNTLLNIDTIFGEYQGKVLPIVLTIAAAAAPLLGWLFLLQGTFIKFWMICVFDLLWTGRWALILIGNEKEKMKFYDQQRKDEYKSADELIHITHVHEDGLIEYDGGFVSYILSGFPKGYLSDARLSTEFEQFMDELDIWDWDLYLVNAVDELLCTEELPKLARYTDTQVLEERIEFYSYQDEWSRTHSGLYKYVFLVKASKYNWKKLKSHLTELVSSDVASCFNEIKICGYDECHEQFNRDICGFVDTQKMLIKKFDNEQYYDSKVLWYDDNVPEELKPKKETSGQKERRVTRDDG